MAGKNGKTSRADNPERDPLAREFAEPKDPGDVHNKRLAHERRMRKIERERGNGNPMEYELSYNEKNQVAEASRANPSILHDYPKSDIEGTEVRIKSKKHKGLEVRLGVKSEDQEDA